MNYRYVTLCILLTFLLFPLNSLAGDIKPYRLYLKTGVQFDDNVRLDALDADNTSDSEDHLYKVFFSGRYSFINTEKIVTGIGYNHYQTWHNDLEEYDLTGSTPEIYFKYQWKPVTFRITYSPSWYWVNADNYLTRHRIKPEWIIKPQDNLIFKLGYSYYDDDYEQKADDPRDGTLHEGSADVYYGVMDKKVFFRCGFGYTDNNATGSGESYDQMTASAGVHITFPYDIKLNLLGRYRDRKYDESGPGEPAREDDKYLGSASLSVPLFVKTVYLMVEYDYSKNNSSIDSYEYERNLVIGSLVLDF
ncbi:surface lipoprotein assembly modifier [Desulfobacterales bacterium HSG16]|nr:surface lipoprotein assembly modifier [Desulfobacterales bacterium HSG16]